MGKSLRVTVCFIVTVSLLLGWDANGFSAGTKEDGPAGFDLRAGSEPIRVSARSLVWDHKEHKATFHEEVVVRQNDLTIHSDDLTIYFNENNNDVTRIVAKGNVRITQMDRRASCEEAVYDRLQNSIVLEGNPVIRQGENEVRGKRVIFFTTENRTVVESGEGERVEVTLIPEKREPGDKL